MRQLLRPALTAAVAIALLALFLGHLADPGTLLATRDVPIFHLPLRTALAQIAEAGLPVWNPMIHGGQPILSNPNYAALYPPTWLLLIVPANTALNLLILLHAALAFFGSHRLARHLSCSPGPALLAAVGFTFAGATLAATSLVTTFCGLAWMPWILYTCDRWLSDRRAVHWSTGLALPVVAFGLQILAGEPVIVITTGLAAAALALDGDRPARRSARLVIVCTLAILLAAIQILPTVSRLRESPRAEGLDVDAVLEWSSPPQRVVELIWPHAWGDPMRIDEDLYFGWSVHDREFAYLYSIYPGQLVVLLAFAALLRWRPRYRMAWGLMIIGGMFLALGAYNPLMRWLIDVAPLLSQIRYPEKFLLLLTPALSLAAALGWQRLLDARETNETPLEDFPLALAGVLAALSVVLLLVLWQRPDVGEWFARVNSVLPLSTESQQQAVGFFRREILLALGVSLSSAAVLALHRWRSVPRSLLVAITLIVLTADLWAHNRNLTPTVAAARLLEPPAAIAALHPAGERIFSDSLFGPTPMMLRTPGEGPDVLWAHVERADPYVANLWNLRYAVHSDFDLMATAATRDALRAVLANRDNAAVRQRILGAWSVRYLVFNRPVPDILRDQSDGHAAARILTAVNPDYREPYRLEPEVQMHADIDSAIEADRAGGYAVPHWVGGDISPKRIAFDASGTVLAADEGPGRLRIEYQSSGRAALTVAHTWAEGWRAKLDGEPLEIQRTSLGMMGVLVPAGTHVLELRYREPALPVAAAISLLTLAALLATLVVGRRSGDRDPSRRHGDSSDRSPGREHPDG